MINEIIMPRHGVQEARLHPISLESPHFSSAYSTAHLFNAFAFAITFALSLDPIRIIWNLTDRHERVSLLPAAPPSPPPTHPPTLP